MLDRTMRRKSGAEKVPRVNAGSTSEAQESYTKAANAWDRYLKLAGEKTNSSTALLAVQETPVLGQGQSLSFGDIWEGGGFMMWPLGACFAIGMLIIVWKFFSLTGQAAANRKLLKEVDGLIAQQRLDQALAVCEDSKAPAGTILAAGLKRYNEGAERVTQAIEIAGEVEATLVAGGIKVALITTASGLAIAIPINIAHNYFVTRVDRIVIDMEESAQKMIDAVHAIERGAA